MAREIPPGAPARRSLPGPGERRTAAGETRGGTSLTTTGTGEREEQRRACCTSEAVPGPPGKAITSTEALNAGEVWAWLPPGPARGGADCRIGPALRP